MAKKEIDPKQIEVLKQVMGVDSEISLRDRIAIACLPIIDNSMTATDIARKVYELADALLAARDS